MDRPRRPDCPCTQDCPDRTGECKRECGKFAEYERAYAAYRKAHEAYATHAQASCGITDAHRKSNIRQARERARRRSNH